MKKNIANRLQHRYDTRIRLPNSSMEHPQMLLAKYRSALAHWSGITSLCVLATLTLPAAHAGEAPLLIKGLEGGVPAVPDLPERFVLEQSTQPNLVNNVFNVPVIHMGQAFKPTLEAIDWFAFVFHNPAQSGAGEVQVSLFSGFNASSGALSNLLGTSQKASIAADTTDWLILQFSETVPVNPGQEYFVQVQHVGGSPTWVGGRMNDFYSGGSAFGFLPGSPVVKLNWAGNDLVFAAGVLTPIPEPRTAALMLAGLTCVGLAGWWRRRARTGSAA